MAKDKSTKKAVKPEAVAAPLKSVKAGRVSKPAETPKAKSKDIAKTAAKATEKVDKKSKKSKKEPTPEPSSESDEEMDSSEEESDSSESESEAEVKPVAKKANGAAKVTKKEESSSDESSSEESDAEAGAKVNGAAKAAVAADSSDEDDSEDEEVATKGDAKALAHDATDDESSEEDSSESDDDEEEVAKPTKVEEPSKKRKAEAEPAATSKKPKVAGEFSEPAKQLFIGGLSWNVDEDWLSREFEEFSPVSVRVITHADTGRSKGFGYIDFADVESATAAIDAKHGQELDGRTLKCDYSAPRPAKNDSGYNKDQTQSRARSYGDQQNPPSNTLFVGNVSFDTTQDSLTGYFSEFGSINGIRLPTDRDTGNPKGYGYIEFSSVDEAKTALEAMNGADVDGRNIRLDYAAARDPSAGGGRGGGRGGFGDRRGGFGDRGGRGGGRGRGGFGDRGGRGGGRGGRGGRGGSTNRGGFGDFQGRKVSFD